MGKLAITGGIPIRKNYFPPQKSYDLAEASRVHNHMIQDQILSGYRGNFSRAFWGGEQVRKFEADLGAYLLADAIALNSCTSALQVACGAIGLEPGDEVIVTPWSMSCSATAPLVFGAVPVFADIDAETFCLDPDSVESVITDRTRAIIVVDLFGQPYDQRINDIAAKHGLHVIEDAAQAIGSEYKGDAAGTLGDIGCFSFTQGKHLTCGEGGALTSKNGKLLFNAALLRNHIDAVTNEIEDLGELKNLSMAGFNMRMTELNAIIMQEQLKKLDDYVKLRQDVAQYFYNRLDHIPWIYKAKTREKCTHSYYVQAFHFKSEDVHRDVFIDAVKAELQPDSQRMDRGVPIGKGYIKPLYKFPLFQNNYHWALREANTDYRGIYWSNVEKLQNNELFISLYHGLDISEEDGDDIVNAFYKVYENREELYGR